MKYKLNFALFMVVIGITAGFSPNGIASELSKKGEKDSDVSDLHESAENSDHNAIGKTCHSDDQDHMCLGVKVVAYVDPADNPTITKDLAKSNMVGINKVWNQCNIAFQLDHYATVKPSQAGLSYNTADSGELNKIRNRFEDNNTFLVVLTGKWNRLGSLGTSGANAWTSLPGDWPYGAILEKPVADFPNIIAHELGHYLSLLHESNASDLMNPIIYPSSDQLSGGQCQQARTAVHQYWQKMIR